MTTAAPAAVPPRELALHLVVDGRAVDARAPSGLVREGVPYVDVVDGVRAIGGLLSFGDNGALRVTKAGRTLAFVDRRATAMLAATPVRLPGAPFTRDGETYVPLASLAMLGEAKLTIDTRGRRALLALGRGDGFPAETRRMPESEEIAPSPTQALRFATSATTDTTGLHARVEITNATAARYVLNFPSAKQIGFVLTRNGSEVWNSVADVAGNEPSKVTIPAHGTIVVERDHPGFDRLGAGRYLMRVRMMTLIPIDITPISIEVVAR